jgi:arylsulfatase A-like enzyme
MPRTAPAVAQQQKPNVVFILADNVGYGDLGPYGGGELFLGCRTKILRTTGAFCARRLV